MSNYNYEHLLSVERERKSTISRKFEVEEFYSDRSRIIYCSSFRRLQQKAQVFSLEPNSSVRTRLTHSIEVSDIGRTLANKIGSELYSNNIIKNEALVPMMVAIVENACLLHDIGNPPFGHFGEAAIKDWVNSNLTKYAESAQIDTNNELYKQLVADFIEFDGNPQGFRTVTKLHCEQDEYGLNLTYATLFCGLKYTRAAGEEPEDGARKKAGYFLTEKDRVLKLYKALGTTPGLRHPLTYIMEAADDIAYCLSDISDGIEKGIITAEDFISDFKSLWKKKYNSKDYPVHIPHKIHHFNVDVSVKWSRAIVEAAVKNYIDNHDKFYYGQAKQLIDENHMGCVLEVIRDVSRKRLYRSYEAESIELSGYAVIIGLLSHFGCLLKLPYKQFSVFIDIEGSPQKHGLDLEWRLFNRIGKRYVDCYKNEVSKIKKKKSEFIIKEWWLRTHLIIDHISGMTDGFALDSYQMLEGIKISK